MSVMKNVAMLRPPLAAGAGGDAMALDKARVMAKDDEGLVILTSGGVALNGQKAAGCLLDPEIGDTVLIVRDAEVGAYILNILTRSDAPGRITLKGDVSVEAEGGTLRLGGESVEVKGRESALVEAPRVDFKGVQGRAVFHSFSFLADHLESQVRKLSAVAQTVDILAERVMQRLKDCFRRVERMDETRAGLITVRAEEFLTVKAGDASIIAENDVKVDGATIRLG